jgi:hypothetical protein
MRRTLAVTAFALALAAPLSVKGCGSGDMNTMMGTDNNQSNDPLNRRYTVVSGPYTFEILAKQAELQVFVNDAAGNAIEPNAASGSVAYVGARIDSLPLLYTSAQTSRGHFVAFMPKEMSMGARMMHFEFHGMPDETTPDVAFCVPLDERACGGMMEGTMHAGMDSTHLSICPDSLMQGSHMVMVDGRSHCGSREPMDDTDRDTDGGHSGHH